MTPSFSSKSRRALLWGALFMAFNGFFVARVPQAMRPELAGVSAAFVLVLWAPSFWALKVWLGWKRAALSFAVLGTFAVLIETLAVKTGWPYGRFSYGNSIGIKYFGVVPWTVPFAWSPLVLGAVALAARWFPQKPLLGATGMLLLFDLVLDPGAVAKKMWQYDAGGWYYDVPFSNFCGWILSGAIGSWLLMRCFNQSGAVPLPLVASAALILSFWTSVCAFSDLWVPAVVGVVLLWSISRAILRPT